MSPLTRLYLAFSSVSGPLWRLSHRRRLKQGKETPARLPEKYGIAPRPRPEGRVLWFHALSVGESLALIPLIERALIDLPDAHVLLTTSTATSAQALAKAALPDRAIHVLLPIDTRRAVRRFLDHWRPDIAVFAELDFWPRLMFETHRRGVPMILVNSRMSPSSFASRRKLGPMMPDILTFFDRMLLQDTDSFNRFRSMGADPKKLSVVGALKAAARPLPCDAQDFEMLQESIGDRPVWLAAATRYIEDPAMIDAHRTITAELPDALLILAPRHVDAGQAAEELARAHFTRVARRSHGETIAPDTQVYIADTIGEMGLWYRLAPVSFIGHSLDLPTEALTGKNPFEAAALGSAIVHGPGVSDFAETYSGLQASGAAMLVEDAASLAAAVLDLQDIAKRGAMCNAANRLVAERRGVLENTWEVIRRALP